VAGDLTDTSYRPDIDGLRAVAVLLVVVYHAFPHHLPGGFVGVDIFFVISGYLITGLLLEDVRQRRFSISGFYQRRIKRIFPALILVLVFCLVAGWWLSLLDEYAEIGKHVAAGAGFVSNLVLWQERGYFDQQAESKALLHLWSLGIEEQFYLLWPLLLGWAARRQQSLGRWIIGLMLVSFGLNLALVYRDPVATFYSPVTRLWELLIGAALVYWQRGLKAQADSAGGHGNAARLTRLVMDYPTACSLFGGALLVAAALQMSPDKAFPGAWALMPTLGAALVIAAGPQALANRRLLSSRPAVAIGLISFPLYLWHWPLLVFYRNSVEQAQTLSLLVVVALSGLLAWATFRWLEQPVRRARRIRLPVTLLLVGCAAVGVIGFVIMKVDGVGLRAKVSNNPRVNSLIGTAKWEYSKNAVCSRGNPDYKGLFCIQSHERPPTLLLLGNSYANHLYPGLANHPSLGRHVLLDIGTCEPSGVMGSDRSDCAVQDAVIRANPSLRFAILNSSWPTFDESGRRLNTLTLQPVGSPSLPQYLDGLRRRLQMLTRHDITPIIFLPKPEIAYNIRKCFGRVSAAADQAQPCQHERQVLDRQREQLVKALTTLTADFPTLRLFDQSQLFCNQQRCNYLHDRLPLLRDNGHLSKYGSDLMADRFVRWAREAVPDLGNVP